MRECSSVHINNLQIISIIIMFSMNISEILCLSNDSSPTSILSTQQTHYIPPGSYFKFAFSSMNLQDPIYNETISQFLITFQLNFAQNNQSLSSLWYNILVFPQIGNQSEDLYQQYSKSVNLGMPVLTPVFPVNYSWPYTSCQDCYQQALYANYPVACLNCMTSQINVNLTSSQWVTLNSWNGTRMTIIDNFLNYTNQTGQLNLSLQYNVFVTFNQEDKALFILYLAVVTALIIILAILSVCLTMKISKVDKQIKSCKQKLKAE